MRHDARSKVLVGPGQIYQIHASQKVALLQFFPQATENSGGQRGQRQDPDINVRIVPDGSPQLRAEQKHPNSEWLQGRERHPAHGLEFASETDLHRSQYTQKAGQVSPALLHMHADACARWRSPSALLLLAPPW